MPSPRPALLTTLAALLAVTLTDCRPATDAPDPTTTAAPTAETAALEPPPPPAPAPPTLKLIRETRIEALAPPEPGVNRYEASGVLSRDGNLTIVLDNSPRFLELGDTLDRVGRWLGDAEGYGMTSGPRDGRLEGFEGIARPDPEHYLLLAEALKRDDDWRAWVVAWQPNDPAGLETRKLRLEPTFKSGNKGLEGLAFLKLGDRQLLIGLCEAPGGDKGKKGPGTLHIHQLDDSGARFLGKTTLPASVQFDDYADLAISGDRMAVVSQESATVWIGTWTEGPDGLPTPVAPGQLYSLPKGPDGEEVYCNLEGIDFIDQDTLVLVSDKAKSEQPKVCREKDQSVHVFGIPALTPQPPLP